ncbi:GlxA family transcriptional regulator [Tahibacter amnicola]|uniref:Helix-turn-helix domain-containing protein n=1 Tax=Tahibacter amnicola TaxID=2976241 RepID=A0ABY6BKT3_9GAMM|nr:helix-turn-helix domain-containing protein [Tahibacter amnicola]UXI68995.1 helix-turn-helix domain-containing protein [Tahibacter amnicola]
MALRVGVLVHEASMPSATTAPLDALSIANKLNHVLHPGAPAPVEVRLVGTRAGMVRVGQGVNFEVDVARPDELDVLVVTALNYRTNGELCRRLDSLVAERNLLRRCAEANLRICTACNGAFLLAEAGLLDGRRATTSWWLANLMRERYPAVDLAIEEIMIEDGNIITTGASTAEYDLCLQLIEWAGGKTLAHNVSRLLLVDRQRQSQAPYISMALADRPRQGLSERAEKWLQKRLHETITVRELADHCRVSERTLLRRFHQDFGATPLEYVQKLRVERAKALLETTRLSFEEIVGRCGYQDVSSFRRLFKHVVSMTPNDYRERYRLRGR